MRWLALLLAALALSGCETSQEKSAKLEAAAKRIARNAPHGLSIAHASTRVSALASTVLHSPEGTAAVLTIRNNSATALRDVPIEITVKDAHGRSLYMNTAPGLSPALISDALVPAHATLTWIDDQVQAAEAPAIVTAKIGEASAVQGSAPQLAIVGAHLLDGMIEGHVVNPSAVTQHELVVEGLARRSGRIVAAGRAVLPEAPAHASTRFQLYFIGDPGGAQLQLSAPATTLG